MGTTIRPVAEEAEFFGDFDVEDALDTEPADPNQVARRLHLIRQRIEALVGSELDDYDDLSPNEVNDLEFMGERITDWLAQHPPNEDGVELAKAIHEFSRQRRVGDDPWDTLDREHRRLAIAIAALIARWLIRQGSWR